jgi:hypothetical protein
MAAYSAAAPNITVEFVDPPDQLPHPENNTDQVTLRQLALP